MFKSPRDYGKLANEAYEHGAPVDLMKYLSDNRSKLQHELDSVWKANEYKMNASWEYVFGKSKFEANDSFVLSYLPEVLFTVYH